MNQCLIIIRGAPASGKSTIAKKLRNFQKKIVWLKVDNFKDFFSDDGTLGLEYANESAVVILDYLLGQGFSVVMEGIFQNIGYIADAIKVAESKSIPYKIYQIRCPLSILQKRDKERPGIKEGCRKPLGDDVIEKLYRIVENNFYPDSIILDTENMSIDECVDAIGILAK